MRVHFLLVSQRPLPTPAWYKNTYFWIAAVLFVLAIIGLPFVKGDEAIRDPGQKHEGGLAYLYLGASIVMLVNGLISHKQTVQQFEESEESTEKT